MNPRKPFVLVAFVETIKKTYFEYRLTSPLSGAAKS